MGPILIKQKLEDAQKEIEDEVKKEIQQKKLEIEANQRLKRQEQNR